MAPMVSTETTSSVRFGPARFVVVSAGRCHMVARLHAVNIGTISRTDSIIHQHCRPKLTLAASGGRRATDGDGRISVAVCADDFAIDFLSSEASRHVVTD